MSIFIGIVFLICAFGLIGTDDNFDSAVSSLIVCVFTIISIILLCFPSIGIQEGVEPELINLTEKNMSVKESDIYSTRDISIVYYHNRKQGIDDIDTFIQFTHLDEKEAEKILEELP